MATKAKINLEGCKRDVTDVSDFYQWTVFPRYLICTCTNHQNYNILDMSSGD